MSVSIADAGGAGRRVRITGPPCALAVAVEAALRWRGWRASRRTSAEDRSVDETDDVVTVWVEMAAGEPAMPGSPRAWPRTRFIAVVPPASVAALGSGASLHAAINSELPFGVLVDLLCDALDAAVAHRPWSSQPRPLLRDRLASRARTVDRFRALTGAETRVLVDLTAGRSVRTIAQDRYLTEATVRSHINAVLRKLGVHSQTAAVALVFTACSDPRILPSVYESQQNY